METYTYKWNIIVAYDKNRGIGAANDLLWKRDLPADLRHFKELTTGHTIIMGRKTYESIGRALPNRQNIVVSSSPIEGDGIIWAHSLDDAYEKSAEEQPFVIGGGMLYEAILQNQACIDTAVIYATEVDAVFEQADVFFPALSSLWTEKTREKHVPDEHNKYAYDFVTYVHEIDTKQL